MQTVWIQIKSLVMSYLIRICLPFCYWFLTETPICDNGCFQFQKWRSLFQKCRDERINTQVLKDNFCYRYMVGYIPEVEVNLSKREYALVGATSSAISRVVSQPLDVIKIRFQVKLIVLDRLASLLLPLKYMYWHHQNAYCHTGAFIRGCRNIQRNGDD